MSRTKIAPTLVAWLAECDRHALQWHKPLAKEARALLEVARAVEGIIDPEDENEPSLLPEWRRLFNARARLRRVSGGAVKGNRKLPANSRRASPGGAEGGGRP